MYQQGFLHRDISIGNIAALEETEEREPFKSIAGLAWRSYNADAE